MTFLEVIAGHSSLVKARRRFIGTRRLELLQIDAGWLRESKSLALSLYGWLRPGRQLTAPRYVEGYELRMCHTWGIPPECLSGPLSGVAKSRVPN